MSKLKLLFASAIVLISSAEAHAASCIAECVYADGTSEQISSGYRYFTFSAKSALRQYCMNGKITNVRCFKTSNSENSDSLVGEESLFADAAKDTSVDYRKKMSASACNRIITIFALKHGYSWDGDILTSGTKYVGNAYYSAGVCHIIVE